MSLFLSNEIIGRTLSKRRFLFISFCIAEDPVSIPRNIARHPAFDSKFISSPSNTSTRELHPHVMSRLLFMRSLQNVTIVLRLAVIESCSNWNLLMPKSRCISFISSIIRELLFNLYFFFQKPFVEQNLQ